MLKKQFSPARLNLLQNIVVAEGVPESVHVLVIQWVLLSMTFITIQSSHARPQLQLISAAAVAIVLRKSRIRRLTVLLRMSRLFQLARLQLQPISAAAAAEIVLLMARFRRITVLLWMSKLFQLARLQLPLMSAAVVKINVLSKLSQRRLVASFKVNRWF